MVGAASIPYARRERRSLCGRGTLAGAISRGRGVRRIAARRGGVFPEAEILRIIDGRDPIVAHGSREMPIWGREFGLVGNPGAASESSARGHAQLLIQYLRTLQTEN